MLAKEVLQKYMFSAGDADASGVIDCLKNDQFVKQKCPKSIKSNFQEIFYKVMIEFCLFFKPRTCLFKYE